MQRLLKILFFLVIVRPVVLVILGLNIRNAQQLPRTGPAVIAANHNSHLDTMVLMSLYPLSLIHKLRPVAAADYFLANKWLAWFSLHVIGIIPLQRGAHVTREQLFAGCHKALDNGDILLLFPEGTRGEPEQQAKPKKGLYYLIKDRRDTAITPVVMYGLGRALPRGEALLVPFICDVVVGEVLPMAADAEQFVENLTNTFAQLQQQCVTHTTLL